MSPSPTKWPREELAKVLAQALAAPVRIACASERDAERLRQTLYKFRKSVGAQDLRITLDGIYVVLTPTRNPILDQL